jgi:hypothetical protein
MSDAGSEDYFGVSLSHQRLIETSKNFIDLLVANEIETPFIECLRQKIDSEFQCESNAQHIDVINAQLMKSAHDIGYFNEPIVNAIRESYDNCLSPSDISIKWLMSKENQSRSDWDLYIKKLHSETSLTHVVASTQTLRRVRCVWKQLQKIVETEQLETLLDFYKRINPLIQAPIDRPFERSKIVSAQLNDAWIKLRFDPVKCIWCADGIAEATDIRELIVVLSRLGYISKPDDHMLWKLDTH